MYKPASALLTAVLTLGLVAGCGGDDPYCVAVSEHKAVLDSFGKKTSADLQREAKAVRSITATAPDSIKDDWAAMGAAMDRVVKAQKSAGVTLEQMSDPAKIAATEQDDLDEIRAAYDTFNDTIKQRAAVVKDVQKTCDITLK